MLYSPKPMHIPDGFLSLVVSLILWAISIGFIGIALKKTNKSLADQQVPLMGVLAAAIFAGQMLNFSVTGGTSGHLLGAAIAVILLGPWSAVLVMTSVVSVQALVFQDGGILALGANLFNMAIVGPFVAYAIYSGLMKLAHKLPRGQILAGFVAAWSSIFIASLACAIEIAISGISPANLAVPAMGAIHALIGIGEGLITAGALIFISAARKDLLDSHLMKSGGEKSILVVGTLLSLGLVVLSPLASNHPDGLEWVSERLGFLPFAKEALYQILPDYTIPGISNPVITTIAAGVLGICLVFSLIWGIARTDKTSSTREIVEG